MKHKIVDYFNRIKRLTGREKEAILEDLEIRQYKKGTILSKSNQYISDNYFILEGCIRQYVLIDGEERNLDFFTEEQWILHPNSDQKHHTPYYLICIEDCTLVIGNEEKGNQLLEKFPAFQEISRIVLEKQIQKQQALKNSFIVDTPEMRYKKLVDLRPDLLQRIPLYHLASYLGIKAESLSRIRNRIHGNK